MRTIFRVPVTLIPVMLGALFLLEPGATQAGAGEMVVEKNIPGWDLLYVNTGAGGRVGGDKEALVNAVRAGSRVGVTWLSWHGEIVAECRQVLATLDGRVDCTVELFCSNPTAELPRGHGHQARLSSSGSTTSYVTVRKDWGEVKMVGAASGSSPIRWYRIIDDDERYLSVDPVDPVAIVQ